jgi:hypothetical protein
MMIDPDRLLTEIRGAILRWEKAAPDSRGEWDAAEKLTGYISALDDHLVHGGRLPQDWKPLPPGDTQEFMIDGADAPERRRKIFGIW